VCNAPMSTAVLLLFIGSLTWETVGHCAIF
jgi:hypothetical protein